MDRVDLPEFWPCSKTLCRPLLSAVDWTESPLDPRSRRGAGECRGLKTFSPTIQLQIGESIKRRSFLKSAAALLPAAGLKDLALAQAAAIPVSTELHLVSAGQDRFGEPHSRGFSTILFKVATKDTGGDLFMIEHVNLTKGGPPLHLHLYQDE